MGAISARIFSLLALIAVALASMDMDQIPGEYAYVDGSEHCPRTMKVDRLPKLRFENSSCDSEEGMDIMTWKESKGNALSTFLMNGEKPRDDIGAFIVGVLAETPNCGQFMTESGVVNFFAPSTAASLDFKAAFRDGPGDSVKKKVSDVHGSGAHDDSDLPNSERDVSIQLPAESVIPVTIDIHGDTHDKDKHSSSLPKPTHTPTPAKPRNHGMNDHHLETLNTRHSTDAKEGIEEPIATAEFDVEATWEPEPFVTEAPQHHNMHHFEPKHGAPVTHEESIKHTSTSQATHEPPKSAHHSEAHVKTQKSTESHNTVHHKDSTKSQALEPEKHTVPSKDAHVDPAEHHDENANKDAAKHKDSAHLDSYDDTHNNVADHSDEKSKHTVEEEHSTSESHISSDVHAASKADTTSKAHAKPKAHRDAHGASKAHVTAEVHAEPEAHGKAHGVSEEHTTSKPHSESDSHASSKEHSTSNTHTEPEKHEDAHEASKEHASLKTHSESEAHESEHSTSAGEHAEKTGHESSAHSSTEHASTKPLSVGLKGSFVLESGKKYMAVGEQCLYVKTKDSSCFPTFATTTLRDGSRVRMDELQIGYEVDVGNGQFSRVFMFTHRNADLRAAAYIRLHVAGGRILVAAAGHYVHTSRGTIAIERVEVGDKLINYDGSHKTVISVDLDRTATGLYNPQTVAGDIVVNGFVATTYTDAVTPRAAHALLAPLRMMYAARCAIGSSGAISQRWGRIEV